MQTAPASRSGPRQNFPLYPLAQGILGDREIVLGLQVDPHLSGSAKISGEPQGRVPGDPALAFDDSANPIGRHAQSHCEGIRRQAGLVQQVLQHFAGMDRREPLFSCGDHLNAS